MAVIENTLDRILDAATDLTDPGGDGDAAEALAAAQAAQDDATAALNAIADMGSDNLLSPVEKPAENVRWNAILNEQPGLDTQAGNLGITTERTAYSTAFNALKTYVEGLVGFSTIPGSAITIVGTTYRSKFADYYSAEVALRVAIAAKIQSNAAAAQQAASTASGTADAAKTAADEANLAITNISSDNVLSKGEKPQVIQAWNAVDGEFVALYNQATALDVIAARDTYNTAFGALQTYLNTTAFTDLSTDTTIVGATLRAKFTDYYTAKQELLNAIAAKSAASDVTFLSNNGIVVVGKRAVKSGGTAGWNAHVISKVGHSGGAFASVTAEAIVDVMFGLNADPEAGSEYGTIDAALYLGGDSTLQVYESGTYRGVVGSYAVGDVLAVAYDGSNIRYQRNGVTLLTTPWNTTAVLYFDSSFFTIGNAVSNLRFGPLSSNNWQSVGGTGKPADNATVGAPAGTNVGSTPAADVSQAVQDLTAPFSVSIAGSLASTVPGTAGAKSYGTLTANITGGVAPVTYTWECVLNWTDSTTGASVQLSQATGTSTGVTGTAPNGKSTSYTITLTATDKTRTKVVTYGYSTLHGTAA